MEIIQAVDVNDVSAITLLDFSVSVHFELSMVFSMHIDPYNQTRQFSVE